jgi:hypothetical protein
LIRAKLSETLSFPDSDLQLDLTAPSRLVGRRRLIREGALSKRHSAKKLYAYLTSDTLVLTLSGSTTIYRNPIPLEECSVKAHSDEDCFTLSHLGSQSTYRASSVRAAAQWQRDIDAARSACLEASRKRASIPGSFF